jgi:hypothetical protein
LKVFVIVCVVPPDMMSTDLSGLCMCRQRWRHSWGWSYYPSMRMIVVRGELQLNMGSEL